VGDGPVHLEPVRLTEDELMGAALSGSERLRRFACHLCGDRDMAEDLLQEGFLRALANRRALREPSLVFPWLFSIIRRVFLDQHRRTDHRAQLLELGAFSTEPAVGNLEEEVLREGFSDEVVAALATLPEEWRTCILLCDVEGLTYEEIAKAMDCPLGTVRSRIARGRAQLFSSLNRSAKSQRASSEVAR
jgi:RNA polymerase sigma factor, sigma-70 family